MIIMKWILFSVLCLTIVFQLIRIVGSYDKEEILGLILTMLTYIALAWYIFVSRV